MAAKKITDNDFLEEDWSISPERDNPRVVDSENSSKTDEIVAGVFCSKRHTGQFNDRFETGEIEFHQVFNTGSEKGLDGTTSSGPTIDNWTSSVVHDLDSHEFDSRDDIMEWPNDYDESKDRF